MILWLTKNIFKKNLIDLILKITFGSKKKVEDTSSNLSNCFDYFHLFFL